MRFIIKNGVLEEYTPSGETDIVIPNGVTCIEKRVFELCRYLRSIKILDSVTSIEECAFLDCKNLRTMEIPNSVIKIGDYAFCRCELQSITIPNRVMYIGNGALLIQKSNLIRRIFKYTFFKVTAGVLTDMKKIWQGSIMIQPSIILRKLG